MSDSDPVMMPARSVGPPNDFTTIVTDIFHGIQYKLLGLVLMMYLILNSDVFINRILGSFAGAVDGKCATTYGTVVSGLIFCIWLIIIDLAIKQKII
jgi:hypothetical protein